MSIILPHYFKFVNIGIFKNLLKIPMLLLLLVDYAGIRKRIEFTVPKNYKSVRSYLFLINIALCFISSVFYNSFKDGLFHLESLLSFDYSFIIHYS